MSLNLGRQIDFITKPYNIHILLAHISAVLLRTSGHKNSLTLTHKGLMILDIGRARLFTGEHVELENEPQGMKEPDGL